MMNAIRQRRLALGLSQIKLANRTGLSNGYISDFELGKRQPWPKARKALAKALKVPASEIFPDEGRQHGDQ